MIREHAGCPWFPIGRLAVYKMVERGIIPAIRLGRRWIVTRFSYEAWERHSIWHSRAHGLQFFIASGAKSHRNSCTFPQNWHIKKSGATPLLPRPKLNRAELRIFS